MDCKLEVAVHAHWSNTPPVYRLYVDDDMLTERTFGWQSFQFYILENILCSLDEGVHKLKLVNLDETSRFDLENFTVNNKIISKKSYGHSNNELTWQFTVDNKNI